MTKYFADADGTGENIAFYPDDIWDVANIPATAIEITEEQWQDALTNRGKYLIQGGAFVLTPNWTPRVPSPPGPTPEQEMISQLQTESIDTMLALTEVYETNAQQDATREQEGVDTMLALTDTYELVLQQQAVIDALTARIAALEGGVS